MMDAHKQAAVVSRLTEARRQAGVVVSRAMLLGGNVQRWEEVDPDAVETVAIGAWMRHGWRVDLVSDRPQPDPAQLTLVPDEPKEVA